MSRPTRERGERFDKALSLSLSWTLSLSLSRKKEEILGVELRQISSSLSNLRSARGENRQEVRFKSRDGFDHTFASHVTLYLCF